MVKIRESNIIGSFVTELKDTSSDTTPQLGGNLDVNGNSIISTSNADINITPDGTGKVVLDGLNYPTADGTATQIITTDGSGNLSFTDPFTSGKSIALSIVFG